MMINEVSKLTGLPNSTIRYYDSLNLLGPIKRGDNNYRFFDHNDIKTLNFINDSKGLGFSLSEIEEILLIKKSGNEPCNFVSDKIKEKISLIEEHIEELLRKKEELLEHLQTGEKVCGWHGDVCHYIEGIDENSKDQLIIENLDSHNNLNI